MKIAFLNKYQDKVFRGAETFVYELSRRLSKNYQVDVISEVNYLDLFKNKYDFIIPTNGRWQVLLTRVIAWLSGSKMIVSGQSGVGWDDKVNLLAAPDAFIALTDNARNWAIKFNPLVRVEKIPNGVDLARFKSKNLGFKKGIKTILCVGAATKQKRLDLVIKGVAKLKDVKLIIASGGGDLKDQIYDLGIKNLGKERFEMISVPFTKMPEIYRAADVFTLPSTSSEAFGNVYVEAMATNLPVVATDDDQRREIVGEAGILVDPTNIEEYAVSLQKALDTNWEEKPRNQAEMYSWEVIAEKYAKLFEILKK